MQKSNIRRTVSVILLSISFIFLCIYLLNPIFKPKKLELKTSTIINSTEPLTANFNLITTNNKPFNLMSMRGKWTLLFFGYADCPGICPATLGIMRDTWQKFENNKAPVQLMFASLNPNKDTQEHLKQFLDRFNKEFVGITGKQAEMDKFSVQLKIYANKVMDELGQEIIDHSPYLMLIDPKAQLRAIISPPLEAEAIAKDLVALTKM